MESDGKKMGVQVIEAAASAAAMVSEVVCALPAVPTLDWCTRASRALLGVRGVTGAMVMVARVRPTGTVATVDAWGVAGCAGAEITTGVRRMSTVPTVAYLDPGQPPLTGLRSFASGTRDLGWAPGVVATERRQAFTTVEAAASYGLDPLPIRLRWTELRSREVVFGASNIGPREDGRVLAVELAVAEGAPPMEQWIDNDRLAAALLDSLLPVLARRAWLAFGSAAGEAQMLTPREELVLDHLVKGMSVREIAERLGRSQHTVHDHVKSLHRKLGASSRGGLVARALGRACGERDAAQAGGDSLQAEYAEIAGELDGVAV